MCKKQDKVALPESGAAFLVPLKDGGYSVCRVLRGPEPDEKADGGEASVLVAGSAWIGAEAPDMSDPLLREILVLTPHALRPQQSMHWVSDAVPANFVYLGQILPSDEEARRDYWAFGGWASFPLQAPRQWRWEHDREALLREDERPQRREERVQAEKARRYQEYLADVTLEVLRKKRRFPRWKGYVSDPALAACRRLFRETIDALIALGPNPRFLPIIRNLRRCILGLNELNEQYDFFIETVEREDLCDEFDEIVHACGLHDYKNLADRWRDW